MCVNTVILLYLWERFTDTVDPYSSADECRPRWGRSVSYIAKIKHGILSAAALLFIPAAWHSYNESAEDHNQELTPPTWFSSF